MKTEQWKDIYNNLKVIYDEFHEPYSDYEYGSNQATRDKGGRKVDSLIHRAKHYIHSNEEVHALLLGENQDYIKADEFFIPRYFGRDMKDFLIEIENKINN